MAWDQTNLDGYVKDVHDDIVYALPTYSVLQDDIPFVRGKELGRNFLFPVYLTQPHGVTFNGGSNRGKEITLEDPISGHFEEAIVAGCEIYMRDRIPYGMLAQADAEDQGAYGNIVGEVLQRLRDAHGFYSELALLYGGTDIGVIESVTDSTGPEQVVVITKASWTPALLLMEGAKVQVYDAALTTLQNTPGTATITITAVDAETRSVTMTASADTVFGTLAAGERIVPHGWVANSVFSGIDKIATNTGTIFSISAATYNFWKANVVSAGSQALTFGKGMSALVRAAVRGTMEELNLYVNSYSWTDMNNDHAQLRRLGSEAKASVEIGTEKITYYGPTGRVNVKPHPLIKASEAFAATPKHFRRIGATDTTFKMGNPGGANAGEFSLNVPDKNSYELRCFSDFSIVHRMPARLTKINNIVNNSL